MENTEQRYYSEPHTLEFEAKVLSCTPHEDAYHVILDSTCFYPEGGGQPADKGAIADMPVLDVQIDKGRIIHTVPGPLKEENVHASVDPHWRYTFMQQHSGQHLLSAALHKVGDYKTKSVHLGEEYSTIEIEGTNISTADIIEAENLAQRAIEKNRSIRTFFIKEGQEKEYNLRRSIKAKGSIRLVEIEGFDVVGCGGIHCQKTGQIKLVKHINTEKIRGNTRLYWKIGNRALQDYAQKQDLVSRLNKLLSTQDDSLYDSVVKLQEKLQSREQEIQQFQARIAENLISDFLNKEKGCYLIDNTDRNSLQRIAQGLAKESDKPYFLISTSLEKSGLAENSKLDWFFVNGTVETFKEIKESALGLINGRGGGKPPMFQGGAEAGNNLEDCIQKINQLLS